MLDSIAVQSASQVSSGCLRLALSMHTRTMAKTTMMPPRENTPASAHFSRRFIFTFQTRLMGSNMTKYQQLVPVMRVSPECDSLRTSVTTSRPVLKRRLNRLRRMLRGVLQNSGGMATLVCAAHCLIKEEGRALLTRSETGTRNWIADHAANKAQDGDSHHDKPKGPLARQSVAQFPEEGQEGKLDCPETGPEKDDDCELAFHIFG